MSFSDLLCVLLTCFVMLHAMAKPTPAEWAKMAAALSLHPPIEAGFASDVPPVPFDTDTANTQTATNIDYLQRVLAAQVTAENPLGVVIGQRDNRLVINWRQDNLFDANEGANPLALTPGGERQIAIIAALLGHIGNQIMVGGRVAVPALHAPDLADWKKALMQADAVSAMLRLKGYDHHVMITASAVKTVGMAMPQPIEIMVLPDAEH